MSRRRLSRHTPAMGLMPTLINALFMMAVAAVAAWTLYPVYESVRYLMVMPLAIVGGAAIAVIASRAGWSGVTTALVAAGLYVVGGLTLAVPGATSGVDSAVGAAFELVRGPILGWKDIATLPLPLGEYRATLVPVYALFLLCSVWATWLAVRSERRWGAAAVVVTGLQVAAIALGPATRAEAYEWAPFGVYMSREFLVGLAAFLILLAWFAWRASWARRTAIAQAQGTASARLASAPKGRTLAAVGAVAAMLVVATVVGLLAAGPIAATTPRDVARSAIDPELTVDAAVTPLADFRSNFTDAAYDTVLFSVAVAQGAPDRVRVATLPYFDGESFTASAPQGAAPDRYQRVPSTLEAVHGGDAVSAEVSIAAGGGIWVPMTGELESITFSGARRSQLVDSFYYQREAASGVMALDGGLTTGDSYTVSAYYAAPSSLADLGDPTGNGQVASSLIPDSLRDWVANQAVTNDGAGLADLVQRLRERGYLSHSLLEDEAAATWMEDLGAYTFVGSAAGHSRDRIDRMFISLNEREAEVGPTDDNSELVAAPGDDEQFATAVALIASDMGYASRVVLGARLDSTDDSGFAAPPCEAGECRGKNMTAWVEVQAADGRWIPVDVTPQHGNVVAPDISTQTDPEYASPLDPKHAEAIVPPSTQRGTSDTSDPVEIEEPGEESWILPVLRIAGAGLLGFAIVLGPILAILIWKSIRRGRRRKGTPAAAVYGGWDEYLDTAVDAGLAPMPLATRSEVATTYATANGAALATLTDRVTFSGRPSSPEEADLFWAMMEEDRKQWLASRSWWSRIKMRLSLRSLWHATTEQADAPGAPSESDRVQWRSDHTGATGTRRGRSRTRNSKKR
ncbi:transglutaminase domain-containing protein [Demequina globuliformis]|uniref:transglutaminase domain-containing protein n=1 Tax=Demequina globuliformis TaxID=676202 RepID=UPI000A059962|nr:transglutaminase domain-containing protein [Demequina globuliformis]